MITAGSTARQTHGGPHHLEIEQGPVSAADPAAARAGQAIAFGPFHLLPARRLLLEAGRPVRLGSRALEILIALVERPGELLSKAEIMARVWPDIFVEQGNLKVQVAGLRRALRDGRDGNRYLATVPGRGYRFVAPITRADEPRQHRPQRQRHLRLCDRRGAEPGQGVPH